MNIKNLTMSFGIQEIFNDVSLQIKENEKIGIIGINGAGKSTFFKLIMGTLEPDSGKIILKQATSAFRSSRIRSGNNEIKKDKLTASDIENRIKELFEEKYGENGTLVKEQQKRTDENKEKLQQKFNIDLSDKTWFRCTLEELRESTFTNETRRDVTGCYVVIYDNYIELYKESVFIKSNMGTRKIFFENVTSIDRDNRGKFHASNSVMINTKGAERAVQLKYVKQEDYQTLCNTYDKYMENKLNNKENSTADELLKWHNLYKEGIISEEEFENKKKELM